MSKFRSFDEFHESFGDFEMKARDITKPYFLLEEIFPENNEEGKPNKDYGDDDARTFGKKREKIYKFFHESPKKYTPEDLVVAFKYDGHPFLFETMEKFKEPTLVRRKDDDGKSWNPGHIKGYSRGYTVMWPAGREMVVFYDQPFDFVMMKSWRDKEITYFILPIQEADNLVYRGRGTIQGSKFGI